MKHDISHDLFTRAKALLPGGVNSPVRAFKSVGGEPFFAQRAHGAYLIDVDGNRYVDYVGSWGPMIAGHAHPRVLDAVARVMRDGLSFGVPNALEVTMAETLTRLVPSCEMLRMVNSGTEATLSAIRLARGATGRERIVKFEGCYHGHGDSFLVKAGSGMLTLGVPDSPGVPKALADLTLTLPYNDFEAASRLFEQCGGEIAGLIIEPIVGNANCILPREGYLQHLRDLCTSHGTLLIFDEVMTGFRVALGGAQQRYGIRPDLSTFGKIIGGGMPVGAYGGRADLMRQIAPSGPIYQAGTLSGNPVAMAAGLATLERSRRRVSTRCWRKKPTSFATGWNKPRMPLACRSPATAAARCSVCFLPTSGWKPTPMRLPAIRRRSSAFSTPCANAACTWHRPRTRPALFRPRMAMPKLRTPSRPRTKHSARHAVDVHAGRGISNDAS